VTAFEHVVGNKSRETKRLWKQKEAAYVCALIKLGFKPGIETTAQFCRRMYEEEGADAPMIPKKQTVKRAIGDKHVPRAAALYDFLSTKFADIAFGWRSFTRTEKNAQGVTVVRHGVYFNNYPTMGGRHLSIYELLFVPLHLIDQIEKQVAARTTRGWDILND
jgi:hypothetical protein